MRSCAVILAVVVMWFSILPQTVQDCTEARCASSCDAPCDQSSDEDDRCPNGVCNPFLHCNGCLCIVSLPVAMSFSHQTTYTEEHAAKPVSMTLSSFSAECFHPPEAVQS